MIVPPPQGWGLNRKPWVKPRADMERPLASGFGRNARDSTYKLSTHTLIGRESIKAGYNLFR